MRHNTLNPEYYLDYLYQFSCFSVFKSILSFSPFKATISKPNSSIMFPILENPQIQSQLLEIHYQKPIQDIKGLVKDEDLIGVYCFDKLELQNSKCYTINIGLGNQIELIQNIREKAFDRVFIGKWDEKTLISIAHSYQEFTFKVDSNKNLLKLIKLWQNIVITNLTKSHLTFQRYLKKLGVNIINAKYSYYVIINIPSTNSFQFILQKLSITSEQKILFDLLNQPLQGIHWFYLYNQIKNSPTFNKFQLIDYLIKQSIINKYDAFQITLECENDTERIIENKKERNFLHQEQSTGDELFLHQIDRYDQILDQDIQLQKQFKIRKYRSKSFSGQSQICFQLNSYPQKYIQ